MSPPLGEEISARNSPGIPLPVLFGALALMLIVPSMYNVIRSAFRWEPAPAPTMVVGSTTVFVTQRPECDDKGSSCAVVVRFDNTDYVGEFAVAGPLGAVVAVQPDGTVAATSLLGSHPADGWVAINVPGQGWRLARRLDEHGKPFAADLVCPSVVPAQQDACRAAAAGGRATG